MTRLASRALLLLTGAFLAAALTGCASQQFREQDRIGRWMTTIEQHLSAPNARTAASHLSAEFRALEASTPREPTAAGNPTERVSTDKQTMIALLEWEYALHRTISASRFRFDEASITATCFAENDLSRLVEFPGWETTVTWTFDARGKILRASSAVEPGAADFRNWLAPAINWLRQHRRADLDWLYPDGEWNRTPRAAKRWVEVLTEWRRATDRRPIELSSAPAQEQVLEDDARSLSVR